MKKTSPLLALIFPILSLVSCASKPLTQVVLPTTAPSINVAHNNEFQKSSCGYADNVTAGSEAVSSQFGLVGALVGTAISAAASADERAVLKIAENNLTTSGFDLQSEILKQLEAELAIAGYKVLPTATTVLRPAYAHFQITQLGDRDKAKLYTTSITGKLELKDVKGKRLWTHTLQGASANLHTLEELKDPKVFSQSIREACTRLIVTSIRGGKAALTIPAGQTL